MHQSLAIEPIRRTRTKFCRLVHRDRRRRLAPERGCTLIEVVVMTGILALILGVVVGPRLIALRRPAKQQVARRAMQELAGGYASWAKANPGKSCPADAGELGRAIGRAPAEDPWGKPYRVLCGSSVPPQAGAVGLFSSGPDQLPNTSDDVRSW